MFRLFRPIIAGATLQDRMTACLGALLGVVATGLAARGVMGPGPAGALMIGSIGASAVLVFAVPASPLAQPWPVIGGNVISALVGMIVARAIPDPALAAGIAVAGAIAVMSLGQCLHPPGGGTALIPVLAGAGAASHWTFVLTPVALNAVALVAAAWLFHRFSGHTYPHRPAPAPRRTAITDADIDHAIAQLAEPLDVSRDDLRSVVMLAAQHAEHRRP